MKASPFGVTSESPSPLSSFMSLLARTYTISVRAASLLDGGKDDVGATIHVGVIDVPLQVHRHRTRYMPLHIGVELAASLIRIAGNNHIVDAVEEAGGVRLPGVRPGNPDSRNAHRAQGDHLDLDLTNDNRILRLENSPHIVRWGRGARRVHILRSALIHPPELDAHALTVRKPVGDGPHSLVALPLKVGIAAFTKACATGLIGDSPSHEIRQAVSAQGPMKRQCRLRQMLHP